MFVWARIVVPFGWEFSGERTDSCERFESQERAGGDDGIARALGELCEINRALGFYEEGIQQGKEAVEICERLGDMTLLASSLEVLSSALHEYDQLAAAEEATSRAINLFRDNGDRFGVFTCHSNLGRIYHSKGESAEAKKHFEAALGVEPPVNWKNQLFWIHLSLARLFLDERRFNDARAHVERAKPHIVNNVKFDLARVMEMHVVIWYGERRLEEANSGALQAAGVYEELGAAQDLERCRGLLEEIRDEMNLEEISKEIEGTDQSDDDGGLSETALPVAPNTQRFIFSDWLTESE
jgi:tetratricopeptide (TPR) repeat protein